MGNPIAVIGYDGTGQNVVRYEYDKGSRLTKMITGLSSYEMTADGAVTQYEYDILGRKIKETDPMGQSVSYEYDRNGNIVRYTYDGFGRQTSQTDQAGNKFSYQYDINANLTGYTFAYSGGKDSTAYSYDPANRVTKVSGGNTSATYTYDPNGNVTTITRGTNNITQFTYNKANLPTNQTNQVGTATYNLYSYQYSVDGNKIKESDSGLTGSWENQYTYDGMNRLTRETGNGADIRYSYDKFGNRTLMSVTGAETYTTSYTYDKNNRLLQESKQAQTGTESTRYYYDPNGNQTCQQILAFGNAADGQLSSELLPAGSEQASGVSVYEYDLFNQLTKVVQGQKQISYTYQVDGLRQSKTVNDERTTFAWNGSDMIKEWKADGAKNTYLYGIDGIVSKNNDYYLKNAHGDVSMLVNPNAAILSRYQYDAFGNQKQASESDTNPFRYAGEYFDDDSGMTYLRARYYQPGTGRFISEDSAKDGMNWYSYCAGNPINFKDPTGLQMDGDSQYSELKQAMLRYLGTAWEKANEQWKKDKIHEIADNLRKFDENSFNRLIYMNDSDGAQAQGHAGILLLNSAGEGLLFSFYPTTEELPDVLSVDAEMRFDVLSSDRVNNLLYGDGKVGKVAASDGDIISSENYNRFVYFDISNGAGYNMFNEGAWLFNNPGTYNLLGRQCDNIANQIMTTGGYGYSVQWRPNETYNYLAKKNTSWSL